MTSILIAAEDKPGDQLFGAQRVEAGLPFGLDPVTAIFILVIVFPTVITILFTQNRGD